MEVGKSVTNTLCRESAPRLISAAVHRYWCSHQATPNEFRVSHACASGVCHKKRARVSMRRGLCNTRCSPVSWVRAGTGRSKTRSDVEIRGH
jgi:hypothetical protein